MHESSLRAQLCRRPTSWQPCLASFVVPRAVAVEAPPDPGPLPVGGAARGPRVQTQLFGIVIAACLTVLLLTGASLGVLLRSIEQSAQLEARNLATSVGFEAANRPQTLQAYVEGLDGLYKRDLFIVDRQRVTVADVVPGEIGKPYRDDPNGEVAQTLQDGQPRAFVEVSGQHPRGASQIVLPFHSRGALQGPVTGAVVLEYGGIAERMFDASVPALYALGLAGLAATLCIGGFGVRVASRLAGGIRKVHQGVQSFAGGRTSERIQVLGSDEVGDLARAFNRMADDLQQSHHELSLETEAARQATRHAELLAYTDRLTGLANRTQFSRLMEVLLAEAARTGGQLGVLVMDLDRFKNVNDTLGHDEGDALLKEVGVRLQRAAGPDAHVVRLGGDEFVIVVHGPDAASWLAGVARKALAAVAQPVWLAGQELRVTASIGISVFPRDGCDEPTLMKHADIALYQAKDDGKNGFAFYAAELNRHSVERLAFEAELRHAIEEKQLSVHYQPKVEAVSGRILGVEALVRWTHPAMGEVSPGRFIPVAEETGLIVPMGRWVLEQACRQQVAWTAQGLPSLVMAVNLSARQFTDDRLLDDVAAVIAATGIPPACLELEITESMLMRHPAQSIETLHALRGLGLRLAVDDFGTGYSSLSNLKRFPIHTLKIDRAFVRDVETDRQDQAIAQAIITMGKSLGLTLVAEGVETAGQLRFLRDRGCDEIQGFFYSRAVPADRLAGMLGKAAVSETVGQEAGGGI